jgi:hypothetical protein
VVVVVVVVQEATGSLRVPNDT